MVTAAVAVATGTNPAAAKVATALMKQHEFWRGKMEKALETDNQEGVETASAQIDKIEAQAKEKGIDLTAATPATEAAETGTGPVAVPSKQPKSVKDKDKVAARAKALAAEKTAGAAGAGGKATPKPKKEKVLQPCLDGCGTMVPGNFKMGHDAKLKSMILKIERGEMDMNELPPIAQELVGFKNGEKQSTKGKDGNKEVIQFKVCTKAPVRFQGRPEITLTTRA